MINASAAYTEIIVIVVCLGILALVSMIEAAMLSVSKLRLRALADAGNKTAALVDRITNDRHSMLASLVLTINLALIIISAFSTGLFLRLGHGAWVPLLSAGMILLILICCEVTPKAFALRHAERLALLFAKPLVVLMWLLTPVIWLLTRVGRAIIKSIVVPVLGGAVQPTFPPLTDDEIKTLLEAGEESGELEAEERDMLYSAIEFSDKVAREVMVPRMDMLCIAESTLASETAEIGTKSGFSRIPVYRGDPDHIVGILYMRDLLSLFINGAHDLPVSRLMRPAYFVPESKKIDELLRDMQGRRVHMAIVIDEYGGVAGLVTIEDVLEEIVGEIRDEYDLAEEEPLKIVDDMTAIALARLSPDEVAEHFDVPLPEGEFDTLGGFIIDQLGRLPELGDTVEYGPLLFEIIGLDEQRIEKVRITRQEEEPSANETTE